MIEKTLWNLYEYKRKAVKLVEYLLLNTNSTYNLYWSITPNVYKKYYIIYNKTVNRNYSSPINPLKIYYIDPSDINKITGRPTALQLRRGIGKVRGGDWDLEGKENWYGTNPKEPIEIIFSGDVFSETIFYRSLENHFKSGTPWEDTELYKVLVSNADGSKVILRGCKTVTDIEHRLENIELLYHEIKNNGYRKQRNMRSKNPDLYDYYGFIDEFTNEVCIDIGRDGELLFVDGKHRLAISKILNLDEIPIMILNRHKQWMEYRDTVYQTGENNNHPDLKFEKIN